MELTLKINSLDFYVFLKMINLLLLSAMFHPLFPSAMLHKKGTLIYNLQHYTGGEWAAVLGNFLKITGVPMYLVQGCRSC